MKKSNTKEFIEKAREVHGNKYDYSKVNYQSNKIKICMICSIHGEFWQTPNSHLNGNGCPKCVGNKKLTTKEFIEKAREVHGNKYDYGKVEYKNNRTKICIICLEHGEFWQTPRNHIYNNNQCPICSKQGKIQLFKMTTEEFITKSNKIHSNKYNYSKTNYGKNCYDEVCIICLEHGEFWQLPYIHIQGSGCPKCVSSKGEIKIKEFLIKKEISFEQQKTFMSCKNKRLLPFDFYLPEHNLLIEYDGIQHFEPRSKFGGEKAFKQTQQHDKIKTQYANNNNIKLLRIPYWENIKKTLSIF